MFDTNLVVVGNVLVSPEWRRVESGSVVANFRIASTARRFDRETNSWVDGNNLRVRVKAWRRLAEGVISSISVGDPVIVYGRLYTRDWKDENGNSRVSYEMEAFSIGHDLARGRSRFARNKVAQGVSELEDAEAETLVGGEPSVPVPAEEAPVVFGEGLPEEEAPSFLDVAGDSPASGAPEESPSAESPSSAETPTDDELAIEVERIAAAEPAPTRRSRRGTRREPVPA